MARVRFLPKIVTVCSGEETGFDCKNNHKRNKLTNFRQDITSKINYKMLVVISYILLELGLKKFQLVRKDFK